MENQSVKSLPPIKELFSQSWHLMLKNALNLLLLSIISFFVGLGIFIISFLIGMVMVFAAGVSTSLVKPDVANLLSKLPAWLWVGAGGLIIVFIIVVLIVTVIMQVAQIMLVAEKETEINLGRIFKNGFGLVMPLITTGIIVSFFNLGSLFLFIIPALFVGFFLSFTQYEVILDGKRGMAAVRSSARIVSQHFGEILIRLILYFLVYIILLVFVPNLIRKIEPETGIILSLFMVIINILAGWYGVVFSVNLYKQAKAATDETKKASIAWMVVIAVLGWLIFTAVGFFGFRYAVDAFKSEFESAFNKSKTVKTLNETKENLNYVPSNCGLSIPLPATSDKLTKKYRHWIYEERSVTPESFRNLAPQVTATEKVLVAVLGYKSDDERFQQDDKSYKLSYPGINIFCVNNTKGWDLNQFIDEANKNAKFKVTKNQGLIDWGEAKVYSVLIDGVDEQGDYFKEPLNLGVTADKKKLFYIKMWGPGEDPNKEQLNKDMNAILGGLKYRPLE
jgi:hypothetical protein